MAYESVIDQQSNVRKGDHYSLSTQLYEENLGGYDTFTNYSHYETTPFYYKSKKQTNKTRPVTLQVIANICPSVT